MAFSESGPLLSGTKLAPEIYGSSSEVDPVSSRNQAIQAEFGEVEQQSLKDLNSLIVTTLPHVSGLRY